MNGDGRGDIRFSGKTLVAQSDGSYATGPPYTPPPPLVDLDGDGIGDRTVSGDVLLGNGDGTFRLVSRHVLGGRFIAYVDGWIRIRRGAATSPLARDLRFSPSNYRFVVGDFNGDGKPDVNAAGQLLLNDTR